METKELQQIVFDGDVEYVMDILSGSEDLADIYAPEIACTGVGGAACKEGCVSGCKDVTKTGGLCSEACKEGCKDGCKDACKVNHK